MRLNHALRSSLGRLFPHWLESEHAGSAGTGSSAITEAQKSFFFEQGYLILPAFFAPDRIEAFKTHLDHLWESRREQPNLVFDSLTLGRRFHFRDATPDMRESPYKLCDPHLDDEVVRDICTSVSLVQVIRELLGANPLVCNTLLLERGSQQEPHFDTFFMPSKTTNMMAASWIAIDRVTETNGPLYYYPKSHLIEPFLFSNGKISAVFAELETDAAKHIETIVKEYDLREERFLPEPGDVLIWHAQLLHGGSPIINKTETRCSLVTHYWTDIDFPDPAQRLDLGDGRWVLRKSHQPVINEKIYERVDALLATLSVSDALRSAVPSAFDARGYLARNQDLLNAGINPWEHFINHGRAEGRTW